MIIFILSFAFGYVAFLWKTVTVARTKAARPISLTTFLLLRGFTAFEIIGVCNLM